MAENIPDNIPQVGPATLAILRQRGVITNLDILYTRFPERLRPFGDSEEGGVLRAIPGIGPGREALLREWARQVPLTTDETQRKTQWSAKQARDDAERAARRSAAVARELAQARAKRQAEEAAVQNLLHRKMEWKSIVLRGTTIGWICWALYLVVNDNGLVFSILTTGFWSAVLGWVVKHVGEEVILHSDRS